MRLDPTSLHLLIPVQYKRGVEIGWTNYPPSSRLRLAGLVRIVLHGRGIHHHHECVTERRSQRWLLHTMRVSLLDDHVDLGGEDVFI